MLECSIGHIPFCPLHSEFSFIYDYRVVLEFLVSFSTLKNDKKITNGKCKDTPYISLTTSVFSMHLLLFFYLCSLKKR